LDQQRLGTSKEGGLAMRKPGASKKAKKQKKVRCCPALNEQKSTN